MYSISKTGSTVFRKEIQMGGINVSPDTMMTLEFSQNIRSSIEIYSIKYILPSQNTY